MAAPKAVVNAVAIVQIIISSALTVAAVIAACAIASAALARCGSIANCAACFTNAATDAAVVNNKIFCIHGYDRSRFRLIRNFSCCIC